MLKLSKEHATEIQERIGKVVKCRTDHVDIMLITEKYMFRAECIKHNNVIYFKVLTNGGWLEFPLTED